MLALRSSLLLYSKGFALLPFRNGVEIAAVEGGRSVSMTMPSPKARCPAVILEPAGASQKLAEMLEAPKIDFGRKLQCILVEIRDRRQPSE